MQLTLKTASILAIYPPLFAFIITGFTNKLLPDRFSQVITCGFMGIACVFGIHLLNHIVLQDNAGGVFPLLTWMQVGEFSADWGMRLNDLSVIMIATVNLISFLVHIYSIGYMSHDPHIPRFMSYLSLFTWAMLMLVSAPNLLQLFFGWEGVGLASYLLIGFWYGRVSATAAGMKAFIVNRIGDVGLALGIACLFSLFQTLDLDVLFSKLSQITMGGLRPSFLFWGQQVDGLNTAAFLLLIGAMGKSAQIGLHIWLPDAMEGPTPVSALIHAATMVTAGVFLLVLLSPLYELTPFVREIICLVGATTAFFAATVALTQTDIKRIIAYSTCSQLGYMFLAVGCSAYTAALFHLVTHAFFKALLFLGAGAIIHAMSDEQDIRRMGGIYRQIPFTYALMWIGSLALAGIPFFSGFYSKDLILESAFLSDNRFAVVGYSVGVFVAILTALYAWRLILLVFHGAPRADERVMAHIHEAPFSMQLPLWALAIGAIFSGALGMHFMGETSFFVNTHFALSYSWAMGLWVKSAGFLAATFGIGLAYYLYWWQPSMVDVLYRRYRALHTFLLNKWYFDEIFDWLFVRPLLTAGMIFWRQGDRGLIDRFGPDGIAFTSMQTARAVGRLQTGYIYHYAFAMLVGLVLMVFWYMVKG
jgi:NADH-quinone oxidoreductase subunit L